MVHLDKVPGQLGHMVMQEDGTVVSSSGELASSESTSQHVIGLISNVFPVDFTAVDTNTNGPNSEAGDSREGVNGLPSAGCPNGSSDTSRPFKWNRITVSFGEKSYVACLSNRKIHVAKRKHDDATDVVSS